MKREVELFFKSNVAGSSLVFCRLSCNGFIFFQFVSYIYASTCV